MKLRRVLAAVILALTLAGCATVEQQPAPPELSAPPKQLLKEALELVRNGDWGYAVRRTQQVLDMGTALTPAMLCEAYMTKVFAEKGMNARQSAEETLSEYSKYCGDGRAPVWVAVQVRKLRKELGLPSELALTGSHSLDQHRALCESTGAYACLVVHQGSIVQEWYSDKYEAPMPAMSSTKSITGLLVGMLVDDGKIKSMNEPVCTYLTEWCQGNKGTVTIRHLLTMTSGLPASEDQPVVGDAYDKNAAVIPLSVNIEPGTTWAYSNEAVQLLSPILDTAAGEPIQDYARKRLFEPLGMKDTELLTDVAGHAWTYADMQTTPRDLAQIGRLMLNQGAWEGRQIISKSWWEQSTSASQDLAPGYGLLWWLYSEPKGFAARGYLSTNLYVFPDLDLIVVRMQKAVAPGEDPPEARYEPVALPLFEAMGEGLY